MVSLLGPHAAPLVDVPHHGDDGSNQTQEGKAPSKAGTEGHFVIFDTLHRLVYLGR